jgi:hypothetical protein
LIAVAQNLIGCRRPAVHFHDDCAWGHYGPPPLTKVLAAIIVRRCD